MYDKIADILAEQQSKLKSESILKWGSYDIESYGKMFSSFYIEPKIKNVTDGIIQDGRDIEKQIIKMKKGSIALVVGPAGCGKSCFLKRCFINGFRRRKKDTIAFWLFASLINEKKPRNQYLFYESIIKNKYTSKNRVIIFIDGVDEIFNNEKKDVIKWLNELVEKNVCVVIGCRKNYYNRFLIEYGFTSIYEIQEWNENQISDYIVKYLQNRDKMDLFENMCRNNNVINNFIVNPFQATLLICLAANGNDVKINEITNVYSLYQIFYSEWLFKERKRSQCLQEKDIEDVHYRIAKEFYNNFNKSCSISSVLTKRQKELQCDKDEAVLSLLKLREQGMIEKSIAEGFIHESFCEFFMAKHLIKVLLSGGIKISYNFLVIYRHFELDFLEEGIANLPMTHVRRIRNNLETVYVSLMNNNFIETYCEEMNIDQRVRKKFCQNTQQADIIRDQCIFFLGKLPHEIIRNSKIFEWGYYHDKNVLVKISAATVVINHGINFTIEKDFILNLLNNELWEKTLRSWVLVFWGDVIYDEPYSYEDRGGNWSRIKKRRMSRIEMEYNGANIKYMRTRGIDLAQLYIFFRNRGWNTMTEEEYHIICECNCDLELYSMEKRELLKYIKECFRNAWENERTIVNSV